jgi:hypothetical protein
MQGSFEMKTMILALVATISGCANATASPTGSDGGEQWTGEGILTVSTSEMQLFSDPRMVGRFPNHCVTIAGRSKADLARFRAYQGKAVTVEGAALQWPGGGTISLTIGGSMVRNVCNSDIVVIARKISPK